MMAVMTATPLISVIVPLEYHRGQWERGWRAWRAQTLDPCLYETILVVPPGFPETVQLEAHVGPNDRVVHAAASHDIGLCAIGAGQARGRYLFFTESHCWPEPDVLERCVGAFDSHPEWSAFSCQSIRIAHNRLSNAEADMYEGDIEQGLLQHPWRKVLDQCFVTRRDAYEACGGLRPELGHFAEWVLAANYFLLGQSIGYLPEARLHHYYVGRLDELSAFTRDFVAGEMRYFSDPSQDAARELLEMPREWIGQGSRDGSLARKLLRIATRDVLVPSRERSLRPAALVGALRWVLPVLGGDRAARAHAASRVWLAYVAANLGRLAGSRSRLSVAFRLYIAALIHQQRLQSLRDARPAHAAPPDGPGHQASGWDVFAPGNAGFHPIEAVGSKRFRWSEPAAILRGWMPAGLHRIRIECLPIRPLHGARMRVFVDGRPVPSQDVGCSSNAIEVRLETRAARAVTLAWTCTRFPATGDRRRLGLPVERIA